MGRVLLLTTVGRRSGRLHTVPLNYFEVGSELFIVASNSGSDRPPAWYLNLLAQPEVTVERGRVQAMMLAVVASGEERARLWPRLIEQAPLYLRYQQATTREIPLVLVREPPQTAA
jgi:deazaflavin-dependent oxidoreductase (nitroreductase family)